MHACIGKDDEDTAENGQSNGIMPQRKNVETKAAENGRAWHLNIKAVLVVNKREVLDLVDDETFEAVVEDGELWSSQSSIAKGLGLI